MPVTLVNTYSKSLLLSSCNKTFPANGIWGSATLLQYPSLVGKPVVANPASSVFTTEASHQLILNSRIKLSGDLPLTLSNSATYYVAVISPTEFKIKATKDGAALNFATAGSNLIFLEQPLSSEDSLEVLINKEVISLGFIRPSISNLGEAGLYNGIVSKPPKLVQFSNVSLQAVVYSYVLYIESGLTILGNTVGESYILTEFSEPQTLAPESIAGVMLTLSLSS
jgi:hypothetical protein